MDIYGYPPYQYNQPDELAKQMFAQQALASSAAYDRETPGPHLMPVPTGTPWNVQSLPWSLHSPPNLVQFTAQTPEDAKITPLVHCKRKSLDVEPVIPTKQFITEEKMAAHLSGLHISSNYTQHSLASEDVMELSVEPNAMSISEKLKGHTIVLSEDVKKLQEEPILPTSLIERLQKPQMSLVVWKPRENVLKKIKEEKETSDEDSPKKRNGVLVAEHSRIDMEI
ncbi:uncharacterized protein LOC113395472 [Vanessa tameamea]|uniref:Uncharacterized protein LOC113395472 n=1 Tax=Vanessa tameamea TaxID=334116 RepID=A0A8B8HVX9_VANTA|nr:uncharacterized protein LOC113395472 [Vanessa tameamea]